MKDTPISNCCTVILLDNSDVCSKCKEHCEAICPDCMEPIKIRNPTGICDHLYYPEYKPKKAETSDQKEGRIKLKTLNDFEWMNKPRYIFIQRELKQEAIKNIKDLERKGILGDLNSSDRHNANMERKAQIIWIKYFFNITEEDLK